MKINYEQFSIICRSLDILHNLEIECSDEKRHLHRIDSELREIRNIDLSKLDAEEQKSAVQRIEEMLGEVVKYLE